MKFTQFIRHIHRRPSPERAAVKTNEPCLTSVWICCILWSWSFSVLFFQGRCEKILQYWASDSLKPTWTHNIEARPGWKQMCWCLIGQVTASHMRVPWHLGAESKRQLPIQIFSGVMGVSHSALSAMDMGKCELTNSWSWEMSHSAISEFVSSSLP